MTNIERCHQSTKRKTNKKSFRSEKNSAGADKHWSGGSLVENNKSAKKRLISLASEIKRNYAKNPSKNSPEKSCIERQEKRESYNLDTLELSSARDNSLEKKSGLNEFKFLENLKTKRKQCLVISSQLSDMSDGEDEFFKHARKLKNCSCYGAFRTLSTGEMLKIGQAMCKGKLCPVCSGALAYKRRRNAIEFFKDNAEELKQYRMYHMVLTVKHDAETRNYCYTSEIIEYFRSLRGNNRREREEWTDYVSGGFYSVEVKQGQNGTPHVHIHCLLMSDQDLETNGFKPWVWGKWKHITKDSENVQIEPVYFLNADREKVYYDPQKHSIDVLERAFTECVKYTVKAEFDTENGEAFGGLSKAFLSDFLKTKTKMYNRFGCLYNSKNNTAFKNLHKLATDYKDLSTLEELEKVTSPKTGKVFHKEDTLLCIAKFSQVICQEIKGVCTYRLKNNVKEVAMYDGWDVESVQKDMSRTLKGTHRVFRSNVTGEFETSRYDKARKEVNRITPDIVQEEYAF